MLSVLQKAKSYICKKANKKQKAKLFSNNSQTHTSCGGVTFLWAH